MYFISLYFDRKTNERIQRYIDKAAEMSGNRFMTENRVPPHITVSAFEMGNNARIIETLRGKAEMFEKRREYSVALWGCFFRQLFILRRY